MPGTKTVIERGALQWHPMIRCINSAVSFCPEEITIRSVGVRPPVLLDGAEDA